MWLQIRGPDGTLVERWKVRFEVCYGVRSGERTGNLPGNVREFQYYDDRETLGDILDEYVFTDEPDKKFVIFAAPTSLRNLIDYAEAEGIDGSAEELMDSGNAAMFDAMLIDEASMMDLPLLFLIGAFLRTKGRLLLVGDHRQMQPIQKHDWESKDRQTIEENTPHVSVLDLIRFLRGDDETEFEELERELPEWPNPDAVIPMDRLEITYRLPPAMAALASELFYKEDGITSTRRATPNTCPMSATRLSLHGWRLPSTPSPELLSCYTMMRLQRKIAHLNRTLSNKSKTNCQLSTLIQQTMK
ncbi:AAA domain [Halogranum amylolyticum]|uniref:AAA domain n=1 Tax=Halogranum amylolyticum TaxID=660520 RepID=A0A1H8VFA3_9EURY|nr:AAA domain [Halogranum amylolyticum]